MLKGGSRDVLFPAKGSARTSVGQSPFLGPLHSLVFVSMISMQTCGHLIGLDSPIPIAVCQHHCLLWLPTSDMEVRSRQTIVQ